MPRKEIRYLDVVTVKRATKGDIEAFGSLIKDVQDQAYKIAFCYLNNSHDAMDCVCRGIEKAFLKIKQLRKPEYFKTWFIRIVINECKLELKRKNRFTEEFQDNKIIGITPDIDLRMMIDTLPPTEKTIVYMKFYGGYTLDEIAEIISLPPGTIRSKLYRTLKQLRKELQYG